MWYFIIYTTEYQSWYESLWLQRHVQVQTHLPHPLCHQLGSHAHGTDKGLPRLVPVHLPLHRLQVRNQTLTSSSLCWHFLGAVMAHARQGRANRTTTTSNIKRFIEVTDPCLRFTQLQITQITTCWHNQSDSKTFFSKISVRSHVGNGGSWTKCSWKSRRPNCLIQR